MSAKFRSKKEVVYDLLHQAILRGDYQPGERLVIDELASRLAVSQIPIREAVQQLEADGFVRMEPYVGATVTEISPNIIFEIFALLETMEAVTSRTACRCMSTEEMETLADLVRAMDDSVDDPETWARQNQEFHLLICEYAQTSLFKGIMRKALDHWNRVRLYYLKDVLGQRLMVAQQEHWEILKAFRRRDAQEVEHLIRAHNQTALASYLDHLQSVGYLADEVADC